MRAAFEPDLVLLYVNPAQLNLILTGVVYAWGENVPCEIAGHAGCVNYVVPPLKLRAFWVSNPCGGDLTFAAGTPDELVFSAPFGKVEDLLEGMMYRARHNRGIPTRYEIRPECWLPDPYSEVARTMGMHRAQSEMLSDVVRLSRMSFSDSPSKQRDLGEEQLCAERRDLVDTAYQLGYRYERDYQYCAQAVLAAIQDTAGYVTDNVVQSAHALSGGLAKTGQGTCGALAGGVMAICCKHGRKRNEFGKDQTSAVPEELSKQLQDQFVRKYHGSRCRDVHQEVFGRNFDLWDSDDYAAFERAGAHIDKCPEVVGRVARWVVEIFLAQEPCGSLKIGNRRDDSQDGSDQSGSNSVDDTCRHHLGHDE
jgi:C_GCAxxG_C_C family probable redox protein